MEMLTKRGYIWCVDGIWYIVHSTENKKNEFGFWEVKEEAYEIFTNSCISGWRTTLEFFELKDSLEQPRTNWVMEEYSIIQKGESATNKEKVKHRLISCKNHFVIYE